MKATFKATNPESIEFTLTLTMSLLEWSQLYDSMSYNSYPSNTLRQKIYSLKRQAEEQFSPKREDMSEDE